MDVDRFSKASVECLHMHYFKDLVQIQSHYNAYPTFNTDFMWQHIHKNTESTRNPPNQWVQFYTNAPSSKVVLKGFFSKVKGYI